MPPITVEQAFGIAVQHHQKGQLPEAETIYRQILAQQPNHAAALHYLGMIACQTGHYASAIELIRQALTMQPTNAEAYSNLGYALWNAGEMDEAITACRQAVALGPHLSRAYCNLGNALKGKGDMDEALAAYRQAIALEPGYAEAYSNMGIVLHAKGQLDEAIAAHRQAIALRPDLHQGYNNLCIVLIDKGELDEAIATCRQAIALGVPLPTDYVNLGNIFKDMGQLDQAIAAYRHAISLGPDIPEIHCNLVYTMHFHAGYDAETIAEEHRRWNQKHAEPLKGLIQPHANDRDPERRLRIGYISGDFREHSVARFLTAFLANHNKSNVEVFAYAQVKIPDAMTQRLRSSVDVWRNIVGLSDQKVADLIRQDQIDILVDLAGHTSNNLLRVMARKPAPVQVTYLGYPDTTGLTSIDYRLTNALADPPGQTEQYHSEQLVRLPDGMWCFEADEAAPPVTELPASAKGNVTFGSFGNWAKVNHQVLRLWAKILTQVQGSTLLLKDRALNNPGMRREAIKFLSGEGISEDRIHFLNMVKDYREHLALYQQMDIALDPFPYHGTTTTCEALWMGVPVITLAGRTHVSRVGVSLLSGIGLPGLVAQTPEEYVQIAANLAGDLSHLSELRQGMRRRMKDSPLMDGPRFARNVEMAYRQMWRTWCGKQ